MNKPLAAAASITFSILALLPALAQPAAAPASAPAAADDISYRDKAGLWRVRTPKLDARFVNAWPVAWEDEFWARANQTLEKLKGQSGRGGTFFENEKQSDPLSMIDIVVGNREPALKFLQEEDNLASQSAHTLGIDLFPSFTLKGQLRKYFFFGSLLDPAYKARMFQAAKAWSEQDPLNRPHPIFGTGKGGEGWTPEFRGSWVDVRNTDNLRAMRDIAVYLFAEETKNEATRLLYKQKLLREVRALYTIGQGEWDSENYHGHSVTSYVNLYDFARDPEVKALAKASLDWSTTAAALKYWRGGWGGPTKRDYGGGNVAFGSLASRTVDLYFGDAPIPDPNPERDHIHLITSSYRPPRAVVALARKQFERPVEMWNTKPAYDNRAAGADSAPQYWETLFMGRTFQLGSVVSGGAVDDVGAFKLMAFSSARGVDYFVANSGGENAGPGKNRGDQIGQSGRLALWLRRDAAPAPFSFQLPKSAAIEVEGQGANAIWFVRLEKTWLSIRPINLSAFQSADVSGPRAASYPDDRTLRCQSAGESPSGFALEVGEQDDNSYQDFKRKVRAAPALRIAQDEATVTGSDGHALRVGLSAGSDLPRVWRDGVARDWEHQTSVYRVVGGAPIVTQDWKAGTLRVSAGGEVFESSVAQDGTANWSQRGSAREPARP